MTNKLIEQMVPSYFAAVNKQGDVTRIVKRRDNWSQVPIYTAAEIQRVLDAHFKESNDAT